MTEVSEVVTLQVHNLSPELLMEFALKVVEPYFGCSFDEALRSLIEKTVIEEDFFQAHMDKRRAHFEKK